MALSAKTVRAQLARMLPLMSSRNLDVLRRGQNALGSLMETLHRKAVMVKNHAFTNFRGAWILPKDERRQGVILYLHGGGFACGSLDYAKGFGAVLAAECGVRVLCLGYRLAPEHPYPGALEDCLEGYQYLLDKGYAPERICLCGESAGGGLCVSLCRRLGELGIPVPGSMIAISPWVDLTLSGDSYALNRERDPSMRRETLEFFSQCYTDRPEQPLVSPLLGDLSGMPNSLIFAGGDEILLSDAQELARNLRRAGNQTELVVKPERWHAYVLYCLEEDQEEFQKINRFLDRNLSPQRKLRWMRLDNAAKIYPAAQRQNWSSLFRLSATLTEPVDKELLQSALDVTVRRFPSIAARLRRGVFWYYLQQIGQTPQIQPENSYPLVRMSRKELGQCAFRVLVYQRRIAVEFFHSLTDGSGGMVFLKTLVAEYLHQKHGIAIPPEHGVLGRLEEPSEAELEDSFQKYAGPVSASRRERDAWRLVGTPETGGFAHVTSFQVPVKDALARAHECGVSLTTFLAAAMMQALQNLQRDVVKLPRRRKPIKVQIPVNLRQIFPSQTVRNFALYTTPEIDPRLGEYSFREICQTVRHWMGLEVNEKYMSTMIAANVGSERLMAVKLMPLFVKNIVLKAVFNAVGERKSCLSMSNLGAVRLPEVMTGYVERFDFILSVQSAAPYNCGVLSYGDSMFINFIRNTRESGLEYHFFRVLQQQGLSVRVQSNQP